MENGDGLVSVTFRLPASDARYFSALAKSRDTSESAVYREACKEYREGRDTILCPKCGAVVFREASFCQHCGAALSETAHEIYTKLDELKKEFPEVYEEALKKSLNKN